MPSTSEQLQSAYQLVREGRKTDAINLILPIVRADSNNADAWWLLANALDDRPKAKYALEQVIRLRPDDDRAVKMLHKLNVISSAPSVSPLDGSPGDPFAGAPSFGSYSTSSSTFSTSSSFGGLSSADDRDSEAIFRSGSSPIEENPFGEKPKNDLAPATPSWTSSFGGTGYDNTGRAAPPIYAPAPVQRRSPIVTCLAIIGAFTVLGCSICSVLFFSGGSIVGPAIQSAFETLAPTLEAISGGEFNFEDFNFGDTSAFSSQTGDNSPLPNNLNRLGELSYGDSVTGVVSNTRDDAYTFNGQQGDRVVIELNNVGGVGYDPVVELYSPDEFQIARNDDRSAGNRDSRISITLPSDGKYTIVVTRFGASGGDYSLSLEG